MFKTLPISEVKMKLTEIVTGVEERGEEVVVTRNGKPAAVLVGYDEFESLQETLEILGNPALMAQIQKSRRYFERGGKGLSIEQVFGEEKSASKKG